MGLTIHYSFKAKGSDSKPRKLITALHQAAHDLPFKEVGEIVEFAGDECNFEMRDNEDPLRWLLCQAQGTVKLKRTHQLEDGRWGDSWYSVVPTRIIAFRVWPGEGCEESNIGLCQYPAVIKGREGEVKTGFAGWHWSSFCKTQYASDPGCGGVPNFLRCHLSLIAVLDKAKELGCLHEVSDEGHFWEKRDLKLLVQEIGSWNEMIAAFSGKLKDVLGNGSLQLESAISKFPTFEKLEAAGQTKLPPGFEKLAELVNQIAQAGKGEG
jgi:hypothetical protein